MTNQHPTSKSEDELRRKVTQAIINDPCIRIGGHYSDGTPIDEESAVNEIMQLIATSQHEAELRVRLDELNRIEPKGDDRPLMWTTGIDTDLAITVDERIAELEAQLEDV